MLICPQENEIHTETGKAKAKSDKSRISLFVPGYINSARVSCMRIHVRVILLPGKIFFVVAARKRSPLDKSFIYCPDFGDVWVNSVPNWSIFDFESGVIEIGRRHGVKELGDKHFLELKPATGIAHFLCEFCSTQQCCKKKLWFVCRRKIAIYIIVELSNSKKTVVMLLSSSEFCTQWKLQLTTDYIFTRKYIFIFKI